MTFSFRAHRGVRASTVAVVALLAALALLAVAPTHARADGIFTADCRLSHRAPDDPIVFRGMPGASHSHDFFGNDSTNATSTLRSLRASGGTCLPRDDHSAYWVPTLYRNGRAVRPLKMQAYYQDFFRFGHVLPFPSGLRIVAGRPDARAWQRGVVRWMCDNDHGTGFATPPDCGSQPVTLRVNFPDCWDGRRLDSPDHRSHMAYNNADGGDIGLQHCPASHPVVVPALQVNVTYPIHDGKGLTLASGSLLSAHADFFNGWKPSALKRQIDRALNGGMACSALLGCAPTTGPSTEPVTARPHKKLIDRFYGPPKGHTMHGHR